MELLAMSSFASFQLFAMDFAIFFAIFFIFIFFLSFFKSNWPLVSGASVNKIYVIILTFQTAKVRILSDSAKESLNSVLFFLDMVT